MDLQWTGNTPNFHKGQNHYVRLQAQLQIHNAKIECFETVMHNYHLYLKCLLKYHVDQVEASSK